VNLIRIFNFPLDIKSLNLSDYSGNLEGMPIKSLYLSDYSGNLEGIQPLSKYIIRSKMCYIDKNDLVLVTACDPSSRNELELNFPMISVNFIMISMAY
jgi:hypothetical protein